MKEVYYEWQKVGKMQMAKPTTKNEERKVAFESVTTSLNGKLKIVIYETLLG